RRISDVVSRGEMEALAIALGTHGLTQPVFDRLEPWFLNLMVAVPQCVSLSRAKGSPILDRLIERSAERAEVPVEGLEEFDDVLGILSRGSYEDQVAYLMMGLPLIEQAGDALEVTKQLYMSGEIAKIWEFSRMEAESIFGEEEVKPVFDHSYENLVTIRNENWMSALVPALEEGGAVVAVGALHLGGRSGLLPMLEAEGFEITAISE
ncbi:MAG: TraB/GumN family protein, partial [Pseudomonadota bacterium]